MTKKLLPFFVVTTFIIISTLTSSFAPGDWKTHVKKGWCVYSTQVVDTAHLSAIKKHKPDVIRWFVEWDRFDVMKGGKSLRAPRIAFCKEFFKNCAQNNVTVIVQMWVKERFWAGDNYGGTQWAKAGKMLNYPADTDKSYGSFVRDLVAAMKAEGIAEDHIIMEAWNEADLLWGAGDQNLNYEQPWKIFDKKGFAKWSGGSGEKWKALHHVLDQSNPAIKYGNSCVGMWADHESWIEPTYKTEKLNYIDLHYYLWNYKTPEEYCDSIGKILGRWDKHLPAGKSPLPFFIGEIAHYSSGTIEQQKVTTADAAMMRKICALLYERYGTRFYGMTCHAPIDMWAGKQKAWYMDDYEK